MHIDTSLPDVDRSIIVTRQVTIEPRRIHGIDLPVTMHELTVHLHEWSEAGWTLHSLRRDSDTGGYVARWSRAPIVSSDG